MEVYLKPGGTLHNQRSQPWKMRPAPITSRVDNPDKIKMKGENIMPGFNQRGPQGLGPMTGRGMGICGNRNMAEAGYGAGYGGRGVGGGGRGMGRGMGRGFGPAAAPVPWTANETALQDRARMLEEELNAIKAQLKTMSADTEDK